MKYRSKIGLAYLLFSATCFARQAYTVRCDVGGTSVSTAGLSSTNKVEGSFPGCTITVNVLGGGLASIFSDNSGTPLSNPFTASTQTGYGIFYADNGRYSVILSGAGISVPITISDILLNDPASPLGCLSVPALTGDVTTAGGTCATVLPNISTAGTGLKTTINAKGQVTGVATAASTDLSDTAIIARLNAPANFGANAISGGPISGTTGTFTGAVTNAGETIAGEAAPDVTGRALGDSSHRWDAFIRNLDISGTSALALNGAAISQVSKLNGFYYVDGVTFSTLQSAITSACAATPAGGTIYLPTGTFAAPSLSGFTLCSDINIIGSGRGLGDSTGCPTTITTNQTSGDLFAVTNMVHIHVSDLCIKDTAAAGANAAIRLNYGQFTVWDRLFISGPFLKAIELDSSSTATGSTIRNTFRDVFDTGLASNGIGCLLDSSDSTSKVINNNKFDMVACQGGATGANAAGIKITNSGVAAQVINENEFYCDEDATLNGGGGGTGILITAGSTADTIFHGCNVENNVTGYNKGTANTVTFLGGNISSNGTNVTDSQPSFTSFLGTRVGGVVPIFGVTPAGGIYTFGIGLNGAAPSAGSINAPPAGLSLLVSGTTVVNVLSTGVSFNQPILGPGLQKQIFTSSGTFTIPTGITQAKVTVCGAGGAGGGGTGATLAGNSGSSGGCVIKWLTGLTGGNTITVTVGTGGTGVNGAAGNSGGNSSVSSGTQVIVTQTGGGGPGGSISSMTIPAGGTATGSDLNFPGTGGLPGLFSATTVGGTGASSMFGGGGIGGNGNNPGLPGNAPGSGGGGGGGNAANTTGGAGANGIVIFEWIT